MPVVISKYLEFSKVGSTGKTEIYDVISRSSGLILATISWYGPWRQYCFYPESDTVFNKDCLRDIEDFICQLMDERAQARFNAKYRTKDK